MSRLVYFALSACGHTEPVALREAAAILRAVASWRVRSETPHFPDVWERKHARVHTFAAFLEALAQRLAWRTAVRLLRKWFVRLLVKLTRARWSKPSAPDYAWMPNVVVGGLADDFLPKLRRTSPKTDAFLPPELYPPQYAAQVALRHPGAGDSRAELQKSDEGTVTMPHVDYDRHIPPRCVQTYLAINDGAQLLIAWRSTELSLKALFEMGGHRGGVLEFDAWAAALSRLASLVVMRLCAGDIAHMSSDTVHMVITLKDKHQLTYHVYDTTEE